MQLQVTEVPYKHMKEVIVFIFSPAIPFTKFLSFSLYYTYSIYKVQVPWARYLHIWWLKANYCSQGVILFFVWLFTSRHLKIMWRKAFIRIERFNFRICFILKHGKNSEVSGRNSTDNLIGQQWCMKHGLGKQAVITFGSLHTWGRTYRGS